MSLLLTDFAPAKRATEEEIAADFEILNNSEWIRSFINTMPEVVAILNQERQIVFGNTELLKLINVYDLKSILGTRPGEALKCINSKTMNAGCGTCEKCRYCGAINSILESQNTNSKVTKDCRITAEENGIHEYLDLKVTTAPFNFNGNVYSILSIEDISDKNRRAALERLFFHDILNIVGSLKGVSDLLKRTNKDDESSDNYIGIVNDLSNELLEEIQSQRMMIFAEQGELQPSIVLVNTLNVIKNTVSYLTHHKVSANKQIMISSEIYNGNINTDPMLLKRVLINMLKNALEATSLNGEVNISCREEGNCVFFTTKNTGVIPKEVQAQIFQRSFSTKGRGRGLGTYSIKLLTERYLHGEVGFISEPEIGTEFYVKIPIN